MKESNLSPSFPSVSKTFRASASPKKVEPLTRKESKEIPQLSEVKRFSKLANLVLGLSFFVIFVSVITLANIYDLGNYLSYLVGNNTVYFTNAVAMISFLVSMIAFSRYFKSKPNRMLTVKQLSLLGISTEEKPIDKVSKKPEKKEGDSSSRFYYSPFSSPTRGTMSPLSLPSSPFAQGSSFISNEVSASPQVQASKKNEIIFEYSQKEIKNEKDLEMLLRREKERGEIQTALGSTFVFSSHTSRTKSTKYLSTTPFLSLQTFSKGNF